MASASRALKIRGEIASVQRTQLLVSVRDCEEARLAISHQVDWIDVKEPNAGSLGIPDLSIAAEIAGVLGSRPSSVALGEFRDYIDATAESRTAQFARIEQLLQMYPYAKFGLSSLHGDWMEQFATLVGKLGAKRRIVPVLYADYPDCGAASPEEVLQLCELCDARFVLVDTFTKDGRSLLDFWGVQELDAFVRRAVCCGLQPVLAGSLKSEQAEMLVESSPFALGFRGAVCRTSREGGICPEKLRSLSEASTAWRWPTASE